MQVVGQYSIRGFRPEDEGTLLDLARTAFEGVNAPYAIEERYRVPGLGSEVNEAAFRRHLEAPEDILVAADCDESPVGFAALELDAEGGYGTLDYLAVSPGHRRRGLGKTLVEAGLRHFRERGLRVALTGYDAPNKIAGDLYRRFGFTDLRVLRFYCARYPPRMKKDRPAAVPPDPAQAAMRGLDRRLLLENLIARKHGLSIEVERRHARRLGGQIAAANLSVVLPGGRGMLLGSQWCDGRVVEIVALLADSIEAEGQLLEHMRLTAGGDSGAVAFACVNTEDRERAAVLDRHGFEVVHDLVQLSRGL